MRGRSTGVNDNIDSPRTWDEMQLTLMNQTALALLLL